MEKINNKKYNYNKTKKDISDLLNFMDKIKESDFKLLPEKLDFLIEASNQLGLSFVYLLLGLKTKISEKNIGSFLISLYFDEIEKERIGKLFNIISNAFNYLGPKNYIICNPIEEEFLKNLKNFGILESNSDNKPRKECNPIENIYFKISSAIDSYNTYIGIDEEKEEDIKEIKVKYDECRKEINDLKNNQKVPNLEYNIDFFNDLLNTIDFNKLYKKNDVKNTQSKNETDLSLSKSLSKSFSQHLEKIPLKNRKFFLINEIVNKGEDIETEFKNYKFFNEASEIVPKVKVEIIKKTICGFLNNKGGRIYFGINDEKVVKGNKLSYKRRDQLTLELLQLTSSFYPDCKTKISIHFIPIKDSNNKFLNDQYVTKMIVNQGDTDKLYSVSNKVYESYIRLQGMVSQIKPEIIAQEIFERKSKPKNPIPEEEFEDPEPEENLYEIKLKNYDDAYRINQNLDVFGKNKNNKGENKGKKRKKQYVNNFINIKIKNIDEETPIYILENLFLDYNDVIIDTKFFENNGMSSGYGYLHVKDLDSAKKIIENYDGMNIYGKNIHLFIKS